MSTYDDASLAARFRALAPEPLPVSWDEILERAQGDRRRLRRPLRSRRSRLAVVIAVALIAVVGAASASSTLRDLLGLNPPAPGGHFNLGTACKGTRGSFGLRMGTAQWAGSPKWIIVSGSGQYAGVTGGGRWRSDLVIREGSKLWIARLWGTITSGGREQRVLITLEGGGAYTAPGRINPRRFLLRPLERGPLKPDSGSQRRIGAG